MQDDEKRGFFPNPFARKSKRSEEKSSFMEPQPGDPGYGKPMSSGRDETTSEAEEEDTSIFARKDNRGLEDFPMGTNAQKRGLALLRDDFLRSAPERVGVGRQDVGSVVMKPVAGEPGYKPDNPKVSKEAKKGKSVKAVKRDVANVTEEKEDKKEKVDKGGWGEKSFQKGRKNPQKDTESANVEDNVYQLPDYLRPIAEDNPGKGSTWKNYGRR